MLYSLSPLAAIVLVFKLWVVSVRLCMYLFWSGELAFGSHFLSSCLMTMVLDKLSPMVMRGIDAFHYILVQASPFYWVVLQLWNVLGMVTLISAFFAAAYMRSYCLFIFPNIQ